MLPLWYKTAWKATLSLFAFVLVAYYVGAAGIRSYGSTMSFERRYDRALFKIDDKRAFLVHGKEVSLVKYSFDPVFFLCGCWVSRGSIFNEAAYQNGNWFYTDHPEYRHPNAYNIRTGEKIDVDVPGPKGAGTIDPATIPEYAKHNLTFEPRFALTPERVAKEREALFSQKESCVGFVGAFYLVFLALGLTGVVVLIRSRWRRGA